MTERVILVKEEGGWREVGVFTGRTPLTCVESAIIAYPDDLKEGGEFCAVPARSWKPVTVKVETKTALRFS
jgi:hypothetical protein